MTFNAGTQAWFFLLLDLGSVFHHEVTKDTKCDG